MNLLTARKDLLQATTKFLSYHRHRLALLQQRVEDIAPERLLKRGYSITLKDGKVVTDATELKPGDALVTCLANGEVKSIVND